MLSNLLSRLLFTSTAFLLVLIVNALKIPGEALQRALEQITDLIRAGFWYALKVILETMSDLISTSFDFLKEAASEFVVSAGPVFEAFLEKGKDSVEWLSKVLVEVFEGLSEMISTVAIDLWNNYKEAISYVTKNA